MVPLFTVLSPDARGELSLGRVLLRESEPGCPSENAQGCRSGREGFCNGARVDGRVDGRERPWILDTFVACAYLSIRYS